MDPHQLQNNLNMGMSGQMGAGTGVNSVTGTPMGQYNPQVLLQSQYINFPAFNVGYNTSQPMLDFQQQQYQLMMQTQAAQQAAQVQQHVQQQIQPIFQQAQTQHQQQQQTTMQQQLLNPQLTVGNNVFMQPQVQQQQQAQLSHQQRLLEEQRRQMEERRLRVQQEQLLQQQREELLRAEARKAEEQRLLQEMKEREERERLEQLRLAQEAARLAEQERKEAEERKKQEEIERIKREQLMKIVEEQKKKERQAEQALREMSERLSIVGNPLTLVATHSMTNYLNLLPFPSESMALSRLPCVSADEAQTTQLLNSTDKDIVQAICDALVQVDVDDIHTRLDKVERETNDIYLDQMPSLIKAVMACNTSALDVDNHAMELLENEDQIVQEDLGPGPSRHLIMSATNLEHATASAASTSSAMHSHDEYGTPTPPQLEGNTNQMRDMGKMSQMTQQMVSLGKQPKATVQRKKKDMVESLFDSLTDYFDPSEGRRKRMKTKTLEEEQAEKRDLELIAEMEMRAAVGKEMRGDAEEGGGMYAEEAVSSDGEQNKFYEKKERRKRKRDEGPDRPPTPTEVIHQRDVEWNERQKRRLEKRKKMRKVEDDDDNEYWNNDVLAENDSFTRFTGLVEQILDQIEDLDVLTIVNKPKTEGMEYDEDEDVDKELLIDRNVLEDLRCEAAKLKGWTKLNKVPTDRLMKLITIMERNMRDVISADGTQLRVPPLFDDDEDDDPTLRELVEERLSRGVAAACIAMIIVTSYKMPKQVFNEDAIERAINICRQYLNHIIFPASDSLYRSSNKKKVADEGKRRRKIGNCNRSSAIQCVYMRVAELIGCFSELVRTQPLTETSIHVLSSMAVASFFVSNVGELQIQAMRLACNIFSRHEEPIHMSILNDILNSLHRLPQVKNRDNSYRVGPDQWISNTSILVLQLVQSVVKVPKNRKKTGDEEHPAAEDATTKVEPDTVVRESFREAQKLAGIFLSGFLNKCSIKGNKLEGEEDYRRLFDSFLHDLLLALYKPEWPAAEMMLTILGSLLVKHYRSKQADITLRQACLDYLGSITARLRKDLKVATEDSEKRLELVVKTLLFEEQSEEMNYGSVEDVRLDDMSSTKQRQKLEQALIDYLIYMKGTEDDAIEYSVMFYAGEWYKETAEDLDIAKQEYQDKKKDANLSDRDLRKLEKKMERMTEKGEKMKEFLVNLVDKKQIRKRIASMKKLGNVMLESDVNWAVKFLASRREFSHSFNQYLKHILYGVAIETTVSLRTKAMRCLTQIIEADHEVLRMEEVRQSVHSRMVDPNAAVREATLELLGKFVLAKEQYIDDYYSILLERIKDSGTAVRKRVIRIMREICEKYPNYDKIPEMLARIVRRVADEEGVKKLVIETFNNLWFQPINERNHTELLKRVITITRMVQVCAAEQNIDFLEQLMQALLKQSERGVVIASKQIVDSLFDSIMFLEQKMAREAVRNSEAAVDAMSAAEAQKQNQDKLLACLTTLSMFSKVRPELLVPHAEALRPYLRSSIETQTDQQILNEVICMLERVVPFMNHPSEQFLDELDSVITRLASIAGIAITTSAIACAAAACKQFARRRSGLANLFLHYLKNLNIVKNNMENSRNFVLAKQKMPFFQRALFSIGLLCRHFDFDQILEGDKEAEKNLIVVTLPSFDLEERTIKSDDSEEPRKFRDNVFVLLEFFSRSNDPNIRLKTLISLGHFCAQYSEYLGRPEVRNIYLTVMQTREPGFKQLKIQALRNLELFLSCEEKKIVKNSEEWDKNKEQQLANLKDMDLNHSGLSSSIIQIYWKAVLNCYFDSDIAVRQAAVQVAWLTMIQALVTPGQSIPTLIAMTTDPLVSVRNRVENLLKEIDAKYQGMVQIRAVAGVRVAFKLQSIVCKVTDKNVVVRGIRACDASVTSGGAQSSNGRTVNGQTSLPRMTNDGQAILSGLYQGLRSNRQIRRSFINGLLRLLSEENHEKLSLEECIFVADNIAMFPYQVMDEPLYAIKAIDAILSVSGEAIVKQFKAALLPMPQQVPPIPEDDDTTFDKEMLFRRFPADKRPLFELLVNSQSCYILLYLKDFLTKLYGFTEAKLQEYSPSEAAKVYEKAVSRRNVSIFCPKSALEELRPEVIAERNTFQGEIELAAKISDFRKMLLSLEHVDNEEGDGDVKAEENDDDGGDGESEEDGEGVENSERVVEGDIVEEAEMVEEESEQ